MMVSICAPPLGSPPDGYGTNIKPVPVANLPAEIAHLYEEASAKQDAINSLNGIIATKDGQLQKWIKTSSALVKHPKEDIFNKDILDAYTKVTLLQDEKLALVQKACSLL